ncbi:MAG: hypothetical protein ABEJ56_01545 [Candidatus Nanohaloarchaea archaeon]
MFGNLGELKEESNPDSSIPEAMQALKGGSEVDFHERKVDNSVSVNMFYPEFSENLDQGRGRDDLIEYVRSELLVKRGESNQAYDRKDVLSLSRYLQRMLDLEKNIRGKDLVDYVEEFIEEDGKPGYLEEFEPNF